MRVSLCFACGNLIRRYIDKCPHCKGTSLEYYKSMESERLKLRRKEMGHASDPPSSMASSLIVLTVAMVATAGWYAYDHGMLPFAKPAQIASAPHAVLH